MLLLGAVAALAPSATLASTSRRPVDLSGAPGPPPQRIEQAPQTNGPLDLAAATLAEQGGRLFVTIATRGDWAVADLDPAGGRRLCITVTPRNAAPTMACVAADAHGAGVGVGLRIAGRVTAVAATRPDGHTITLTVDPAVLRLGPGAFAWQVGATWTDAAACPSSAPCEGLLPSSGPASFSLVAVGCRRTRPTFAFNGSRAHRVVALTFDDGPWPDTPRFVAALERRRVPATFFLIGRQVAGQGTLLRRELDDGDALGNHSWSHPDLTRTRDVRGQLAQTSAAIEQAAGYQPCVVRPPYGARSARVIAAGLAQGMSTVTWDVDPRDFARPGTAAIVRRVLGAVRNGSIVLLHDGGGVRDQTLAAVPRIIDALRVRGYTFATVPQLLGYATLYA